MMTGIENIIYRNSAHLRGKPIAFDLDGTLIMGDLGETLFFFAVILRAKGRDFHGFLALLQEINSRDEVQCADNQAVSDLLQQYFSFLNQGEPIEAYRLTTEFLSAEKIEDIRAAAVMLLKAEIPARQILLKLGQREFKMPIQVVPEPAMSRMIHQCVLSQAKVLIISGSPQPVVEGYCLYQGLPISVARGAVKDQNGEISVPFGRHKLDILTQEGFPEPYIAFGNSIGDFEMLNAAVYPVVRKNSSQKVLDWARKNCWRFI